MHVGGWHCRHLAALDFGDPAVRIKDEDIDGVAVPAGFNGRGSRIARGRADNRHPLPATGQYMIEQPTQQLHWVVLERQGRAVKQLHQPDVGVELFEGRHRAVGEIAITVLDHIRQIGFVNATAEKRRHHPDRKLGIAHALHGPNVASVEDRPRFRQVKTAVARQTSQQHFIEF